MSADETLPAVAGPLDQAADLAERHDWTGYPALYVLQADGGGAEGLHLAALPIPEEMWTDATPAEGLRTVAGAVRAVGMPPGFRSVRAWLAVYPNGGQRHVTILDDSGCSHYIDPVTAGSPADDPALPGRVAAALTAVNRAASGA